MNTGRLHAGRGRTVGAVTLFPVWAERAGYRRAYVTTTQDVALAEMQDGPAVSQLRASNRGAEAVLILDGQLFEGGWQHRMATRSHLIPAGTRQAIDVACVERDRWGGGDEQRSHGRRSPASIRVAAEHGGQEEVWRRIDRRFGPSETGSLLGGMQAADEQTSLLMRHVRPLVGQVGLLVGIGGIPATLEVFDDPRTLQEQARHVVRAASLDALGCPALPTPDRMARQTLASVERCGLDMEPRVGQAARLGRGASRGFDVMALNYKLTCLHLTASNTRHPVLQAA